MTTFSLSAVPRKAVPDAPLQALEVHQPSNSYRQEIFAASMENGNRIFSSLKNPQ